MAVLTGIAEAVLVGDAVLSTVLRLALVLSVGTSLLYRYVRGITCPEAVESELDFGLKTQRFGALFSASVIIMALHPRLPG